MKVEWIVYGALSQPTGGYVYDRILVERLRELGMDVAVASISEGSDPRELVRLVTEARADVVVGDALCAREIGPAFEVLPAMVAKILLVHHFASWEVEAGDRDALHAVEARAVASSDRVVVTSASTASSLAHEYPGLHADVIVPGADRLPRLPRVPRDPSRVELLFVGSLIPRKRLPLLLDALIRLGDARVTLRIAGDDGRDPTHAREIGALLARSELLSRAVSRLGVLDEAPLAQELARADALVLPSSLEGYGMVLTEALHAGVPVLCARAAAVPESVREGGAALLFDPDEELPHVLDRFVRDVALRDRLQRAASALSSTLPTWGAAGAAFHGMLTSARDSARANGRAR